MICLPGHMCRNASYTDHLCTRPANERRRYIVTSSLIAWVLTQHDIWSYACGYNSSYWWVWVVCYLATATTRGLERPSQRGAENAEKTSGWARGKVQGQGRGFRVEVSEVSVRVYGWHWHLVYTIITYLRAVMSVRNTCWTEAVNKWPRLIIFPAFVLYFNYMYWADKSFRWADNFSRLISNTIHLIKLGLALVSELSI